MGYRDWLEMLLKILSRDTKRIILQGTNKKKYWTVEAHEDRKIILNKERQLILRNIEFMFRVYFTGVVFVVLNHLFLFNATKAMAMFLGKVPYTFEDSETKFIALPILASMYLISGFQHVFKFEEGLIGVNLESKRVKLLKSIMIVQILCSYILNSLLFWYGMAPLYLFLYGCYSFIILIYFFLQMAYLSKQTIYCFRSCSKYSNPDPKLVRLDRDISIQLKQGRELQIDLLTNNLYICDSDDILISPNIRSPYFIRKESIKYLQIKDVKIVYDGNKWTKLDNQI